MEITQDEKKVIDVVRRLKPYGKVEIAMNQSGKELSIILTNPERTVVNLQKISE